MICMLPIQLSMVRVNLEEAYTTPNYVLRRQALSLERHGDSSRCSYQRARVLWEGAL